MCLNTRPSLRIAAALHKFRKLGLHFRNMSAAKVTVPPGETTDRLIGINREFESESHARSYSRFRPHYPSEVVETMVNYCCKDVNTGSGLKLALDLGCGSGQSTEPLAAYFDQVIGVEVSPSQHAEAQKSPTKPCNVTYRLGPGEDLSFQPDESVDMISVAQALHWFDLETLYKEVRRVLRPGGLFAAYSYQILRLDNPKGTELIEKLYVDPLGPYWHEKIRLLDDSYRDIQAPFTDDKRLLKIYLESEAEVMKSTEINVTMLFPVLMIMSKKPED